MSVDDKSQEGEARLEHDAPGSTTAPRQRASTVGGGAASRPRAATSGGETTVKLPLDILGEVDIFAGLPRAQLRRVVDLGVEESYRRGATIFSEGDAGDKFYLILSGAVRITRFVAGMGEEALAVVRPGAYFGEMSLIDEAPRSAAAIAHESCRLFVVSRRDLEDLLFVDRDLAYELLWNFVRTLSRRLRATNDKMTFLATTNKF